MNSGVPVNPMNAAFGSAIRMLRASLPAWVRCASSTSMIQRDGGSLPSMQSDTSGLACLRTDWSIDADVLVVKVQPLGDPFAEEVVVVATGVGAVCATGSAVQPTRTSRMNPPLQSCGNMRGNASGTRLSSKWRARMAKPTSRHSRFKRITHS